MRIRFVDSKTGFMLKISDIFEDTSYIGMSHSGLGEENSVISGDLIDGSQGTNAFSVRADTELVFDNIPVVKELGNYYLVFNGAGTEYLFPDKYVIPTLDLVESVDGAWTVTVALDEIVLIVGDVTVTSENASDILGNGTAMYNAAGGILTLRNANITANYAVSTNMEQLTVEIPSGTTTTLTIAPEEYRRNAAAVEASCNLSVIGGGTLVIKGANDVNAISGGFR